MNKSYLNRILSIFICLGAIAGCAVTTSNPVTITPSEMKWVGTPNKPGREQANLVGETGKPGPYVVRVKLPANFTQQAHSHPDERSYNIISGTWYIGWGTKFDESKLIALPAGSFYIEAADQPHFVATKEDGAVIQISGTGPSGQHFVDPAHEPKK